LALNYKLKTIYLQDLFCTQKSIPWAADELLGPLRNTCEQVRWGELRDTSASTAILLYVCSQGLRSEELVM